MSSYSVLRTAWSLDARAFSKALLMTESLKRLKFTGLSQLFPVTPPASSVPISLETEPVARAGGFLQCHHTHWVSGSKPGWFRQPDAWNLPAMASLISVASSTCLMFIFIPAACTYLPISCALVSEIGSEPVLNVNANG